MPAYYRATFAEFVSTSDSELAGILTVGYASAGFTQMQTQQALVWVADCQRLRQTIAGLVDRRAAAARWGVLLEFEIPRKEKRIDVVLLIAGKIVLLEFKSGEISSADRVQAEEYALLLHYFHKTSRARKIVPLLISEKAVDSGRLLQEELRFEETPRYWIEPVRELPWEALSEALLDIGMQLEEEEWIDPQEWEAGAYHPIPSIIEATLSLHRGLAIREIAHSEAAKHDVDKITGYLLECVAEARNKQEFAIFFVTGVPGSGKTLIGLNVAYSRRSGADAIHFMSGNGPLVKVLQKVLAKYQMSTGVRALDARIQAKTLIENVHVFAKTYTDQLPDQPPSNHVIIFDEAQRAWDREQNLRKFKRNYSEPEMLLRIMERHADWGVVIALVGGGQEINNGEAGLTEWGRALAETAKRWKVFASPEAIDGGASVAGGSLRVAGARTIPMVADDRFHLGVSLRSLRAERFAQWVNRVLEGEADEAAELKSRLEFPVFLTRSLEMARRMLRQHALGESRCGLVGSSGAARLRAEGLEPDSNFHAEYPWEHWYLAERTDVRSSAQLEVFATEFEIQGLELDWIGLCWGGDMVWSKQKGEWVLRLFSQKVRSSWSPLKKDERRKYRKNAYRVLLTRARQGLVIYVPRGDEADPTRNPVEFEETAEFLISCGVRELDDVRDVEMTLAGIGY